MRKTEKMIKYILLALGIVMMFSLLGCSRGNNDVSQQEIDAMFAQAKELNENSELPYDYLVSFEQYSYEKFISSGIGTDADWEYIDWKNIDAGDDHPYTIWTDNLDFEGYFFPLSDEEHKAEYLYLTQMYLKSADYHVYSVSVGSDAEAAAEIFAAEGFVRTDRFEGRYCFEKHRVMIVLDADHDNTITCISILTDA